ncbi:class I SAM-dependent methyltransferase [Pseudoruegeria sp. HB172150]|uniref:class I SAM-dependent methyltransferase n=1 Tax=Pseudoruegeria sp. HB172150 TaxID=2721164 RepID=UPI001555A3ED|nr:class I SAM-dependent methyltransferase [Pseudoruegeria sp. HB172150]
MAVAVSEEELEAGRGYEGLFVPAVFSAWTADMLDAADVGPGAQVLDVACGTGVLARDALTRTGNTGRVTGLDMTPGMIVAAEEAEPGIEWVLGQAEALPFGDATFVCVLSQFGIMFFEDRQKAAAEMFRVLKPGGRIAVAAWHGIDRNPAYADVSAVLDEAVSRDAGDKVRIPFCLDDPDATVATFAKVGFVDIGHTTHTHDACFPSTRTMVEVELRGWLPVFGIHLDEKKIADVLKKSDDRLAKYASSTGEAVFGTSGYIVTGRKPG